MTAKFSLYVTAIMLAAILTVGVGCTKAPNDAQLASDIQTKLASDSGLQGKQLGVKAEAGTVTLTGTVSAADYYVHLYTFGTVPTLGDDDTVPDNFTTAYTMTVSVK